MATNHIYKRTAWEYCTDSSNLQKFKLNCFVVFVVVSENLQSDIPWILYLADTYYSLSHLFHIISNGFWTEWGHEYAYNMYYVHVLCFEYLILGIAWNINNVSMKVLIKSNFAERRKMIRWRKHWTFSKRSFLLHWLYYHSDQIQGRQISASDLLSHL